MTDSEKVEFLKYGCLSRAIIKICDGPSIEEFCAKYNQWFRTEYYGMPQGDKVALILRDFGYSVIADEWGFDDVRKRVESGNKVLLLSHVSLNDGETHEINHVSVLEAISDEGFTIWTSSQNGWAGTLPEFKKLLWTEKKCHGLSLQRLSDSSKA